jgi:predicted thioesterase
VLPFDASDTATLDVTVTDAMTVQFDQLGALHRVYSTYTMAKHFEEVGRKLLVPHLEPFEQGIGSAVNVEHVGMALPGMQVRLEARFDRLQGRRLWCSVRAWNELGDLIGRGSTVQVVMAAALLERRFADLEVRLRAAK